MNNRERPGEIDMERHPYLFALVVAVLAAWVAASIDPSPIAVGGLAFLAFMLGAGYGHDAARWARP